MTQTEGRKRQLRSVCSAPALEVTVEITLDSNHHFLPMPKMHADSSDEEGDEDDAEDIERAQAMGAVEESVSSKQEPKNTSKLAGLMRKIRGGAKKLKKPKRL